MINFYLSLIWFFSDDIFETKFIDGVMNRQNGNQVCVGNERRMSN